MAEELCVQGRETQSGSTYRDIRYLHGQFSTSWTQLSISCCTTFTWWVSATEFSLIT